MPSQTDVRWTKTDRGFKHYAPVETERGTVTVYESSAAETPCLWIDVAGDLKHVTLDTAREIRDMRPDDDALRATLTVAIDRHYQANQYDPKDWKAGDPCAQCGSEDTDEVDGIAICRGCGATDEEG